MTQMIKSAVKDVFFSFSPQLAQLEAMINLDFKLGEERLQLMKLCFSPLAVWPLLLGLLLICVDPTKHLWSLQWVLQGNYQITFMLLDGRLANVFTFYLIFFVIARRLRSDYLLIASVFYFLAKSDLHFHLALAAALGTFLGRGIYLLSLGKTLASEAKQLWKIVTSLQLAATLASTVITVWALQNLTAQGYFSQSMTINRSEFFICSIGLHYFLQFVVLSTWGHFRQQKLFEPSDFPTCYSTSTWLTKLKLRSQFIKNLKPHVASKIKLHQSNLNELQMIKDQSPVSIPAKIAKILQTELEYLKLASSRLTPE